MLPLAIILRGLGYEVDGSDRSHDQGRNPEKFRYILDQGIELSPQDGSGLHDDMTLVVSSAIENTIPEVRIALERNIPIIKRAALLAQIFNKAKQRVAVAGTSGKSTTTGFIGYLLHRMGKNPTVMNGAVFRNFASDDNPFVTALTGDPDLFVIEADESDGSIELYTPTIAVLNNISFDHKSMDELRSLFSNFIGKSQKAVVNIDNAEVATLTELYRDKCVTYSLSNKQADFYASDIEPRADGTHALISRKYSIDVSIPGRHNLSNALASLATVDALGLDVSSASKIIHEYAGVKRRMEITGVKNKITVIDDFAHNPDKIEATLSTLRQFSGRLLIIFQMHGFGPLKLMHKELAETFRKNMDAADILFMPEVLYMGGTADRSYTAKDFISELRDTGTNAVWYEQRDEIPEAVIKIARAGDRIVVMGARDDSLSTFACQILEAL